MNDTAPIMRIKPCCDLMVEALFSPPHIQEGPVGAYIINGRGAAMSIEVCPWCGRKIAYEEAEE